MNEVNKNTEGIITCVQHGKLVVVDETADHIEYFDNTLDAQINNVWWFKEEYLIEIGDIHN